MSPEATVRILETPERGIREHGQETYPNECCGALLGKDGEGVREISDILPLKNQHKDSPRNRFILTPEDVRKAETHAKRTGSELLGWYHSHPDAPARPSEFDREHAWPWYSYVIVSVKAGKAEEMNSWRLAGDRSRYDAERIEVNGKREGPASAERVNAEGEGRAS